MDMTDRDTLYVEKVNETYLKIHADPGVRRELYDYFAFRSKKAQFDPRVKNKTWDGMIRLYKMNTSCIYTGNLNLLKKFCESRNYDLELEDGVDTTDEFSLIEARKFMDRMANGKFVPHDHQVNAFCHSIRKRRALILSPTASGKSFIIYSMIMRLARKTLLLVPSIGLVSQMRDDFAEYGLDVDTFVHTIAEGSSKVSDKPIIIATWQSVFRQPASFFNKFKVILGDEAHEFDAESLKGVMEKCENVKYRVGFTGTLEDIQSHRLVLEGLFGPAIQVATTRQLIDENKVANVLIKIITLKHPPKSMKYADEFEYLVTHQRRNNFIKNLALSLDGNVMILYERVEQQGKPLFESIEAESPDRKCFFVDMNVDMDERNDIRAFADREKKSIIVASYKTFSRGINIKNVNYIILASPSKSKIRILQSIGRGLRLAEGKDHFILFDIADDLGDNTTLNHLYQRIRYYIKEQFEMKQYNVDFGGLDAK